MHVQSNTLLLLDVFESFCVWNRFNNQEKKKKHDEAIVLAKSKWNSVKLLISKGLIDSNISHNLFLTIMKWKSIMILKKK